MSGENTSNHGITFLGLLQVLFIGLKLAKVIDWNWWVVLLPLIAEIGICVFWLAVIVIATVIEVIRDKKVSK